MELGTGGTVLMLLGLIFLCDCFGTKGLLTRTKERASSNSGNKLNSKRDLIIGTQHSRNGYVKHKPSKWKQLRLRKGKSRKRDYVTLTTDVPRSKTTSARNVIIGGSLSNYRTTGGSSDGRLPIHPPQITESTFYRRKKAIPGLDHQDQEETEDSLDKRSRNRVKLKAQWPHSGRGNSQLTGTKHVIMDKKTTVDGGQKRQRISGGMVPQPGAVQYGIPHGMSEALGVADGDNSLPFTAMAGKPRQVLHPSHFYTQPVHKFMPVEHRYISGPIHRYLSSPVDFRRLNRVGFPFVAGGGGGPVVTPITGPLEGTVLSPMYQDPQEQGRHVVIVNRPVKTPIPVPVRGPPDVVLVHHPVPMPPQRVPVPVLVQHQRRQPIIIVHQKEFSGPVIDPCGVNPCRNGGTCSAIGSEFKCICPVGYKSERCEVQSKCFPNPCKNFGKCTELPDDYECTCRTGFHGKSCDLESKCEPNPCRNGGVCTENLDTYICSCSVGFMGKNCEQESKCLPVNPCKNGGVCTEGLNGYKCNCKDGFAGINCEVREIRSPCDSNPCHNGATCILEVYDSSKFSCYCAAGFTGFDCLDVACSNCPSPGRCVEGVCTMDFINTGRSPLPLALRNPPCGPTNPCLFGGHCVSNGVDYSCLCPHGQSGPHCEHFYQESSCDGCHRHAVCISSKCTCRQEYVGDGKTCRLKTSHCHPNPCENGGTCHEEENAAPNSQDWWCECAKGYNGRHCHEYDPCNSYKCHNGGQCEAVNFEPRCKCEAPWEGPTCLYDNFCLPRDGVNRNPCKNGGKCEFVNGEVTCICPIEYEGPRCNINKCDKCDKNAFCEQGQCKCRPPYTGDGIDCTLENAAPPVESFTAPNYCDSNPCRNGATCVDGKTTFYCACEENTFGRLCEKSSPHKPSGPPPKAVCHPNPCLNGGMCKEMGANQDFDCICPNAQYKGRFCDVDMCAECDPHARCINGKCSCRKGFVGDGYSCKKVKPKCKCPPFSTCVGGSTCICNPGFSMNSVGKRTCIPNVESQPVVSKTQHGLKTPIPKGEARPTVREREWSEDIIVTEYRSLGCWSDTTEWKNASLRAMMVMEGLDPLLAGDYKTRKQPISKCADVAKRLGFRIFAIQNGGQCFAGSDNTSYKKYGQSEQCLNGVGGSLANDVYKL